MLLPTPSCDCVVPMHLPLFSPLTTPPSPSLSSFSLCWTQVPELYQYWLRKRELIGKPLSRRYWQVRYAHRCTWHILVFHSPLTMPSLYVTLSPFLSFSPFIPLSLFPTLSFSHSVFLPLIVSPSVCHCLSSPCQPTNASDNNPYHVFRVRDKERYRLRKQARKNDVDSFRKMQQIRADLGQVFKHYLDTLCIIHNITLYFLYNT